MEAELERFKQDDIAVDARIRSSKPKKAARPHAEGEQALTLGSQDSYGSDSLFESDDEE